MRCMLEPRVHWFREGVGKGRELKPVNHRTYHRGQITTLLRQLHVPVVSVDYLVAHDVHFAK